MSSRPLVADGAPAVSANQGLSGPDSADISANLDLLRAMAVLCVYVAHLLSATKVPNVGSLGRFGVILFFVHTSFVLMASLHRMSRSYGTRELFLAFALRRFFRIYPLSASAVLAVTLLKIPPGLADSPYVWIGWRGLVSNLAITQSMTYSPLAMNVLWSLPLEVQMYCLLPFMYLAILSKRSAAVLLLVLSFAAALTIPHLTGRLVVFSYAPCFTAGVCGFALSGASKLRLPAWTWPVWIFAAIAAYGPRDNVSLPDKLPRAWLVSLAVGLAIPCFREIGCRWLRIAAHQIAKYSYGIYLSHTVVLWLAFGRMAGFPLGVRIAVVILRSVLCPVVMYHLIEAPAISSGKKLASRTLRTLSAGAG